MSKSQPGYELIPLLEMANRWYSKHQGAMLPTPSCIFNPDDIGDIDVKNEDTYALFYTRSSNYSRLCESGTILRNLSTHLLPLFAGIHQKMPTEQLAQIITNHGITVDDYEDMVIARQSMGEKLLENRDGKSISFIDAKIEVWKVFDSLGMILPRNNAPESSNYAAMHTTCEGAWPSTIFREIAKGNLADESGFLMDSTSIVGWPEKIEQSHFPGNDALAFIRRSGMLESAAYRKQLGFHHLWEAVCNSLNDANSTNATRLLLECKKLSLDEQLIVRDALRSMHTDRGRNTVGMPKIYSKLSLLLKGTVMDVSDSLIAKINLSGGWGNGTSHRNQLMLDSDNHLEFIEQSRKTLSMVSQEILDLKPHQIGYAHLTVFTAIKKIQLGEQQVSGFRPEDLILRLEEGLKDFMGLRTNTNKLTERMYSGLSDAFGLFVDHAWDYSAFKDCSQQTVLTLVRGGAAMGKLPDMGRKRRGQFLEDELGM